MIKRIVDKRGGYYTPEGAPEGTDFFRLMSKIAVMEGDKLQDVCCDLSPRSSLANKYIGEITSYDYDYEEDRYKFAINISNSDNIVAGYEYYIFIGARIFRIDDIAIDDSYAYIDTTTETGFYSLMRTSEDKGLIAEGQSIEGTIWATAAGVTPVIEYEAAWPASPDVKIIDGSKLTTIPSTIWRELEETTGVITKARNSSFVLNFLTGVASISNDSIYAPNYIEFIADIASSVKFKLRIYMNISDMVFTQLSKYRINLNQKWAAMGTPYLNKYPESYDAIAYYDAEDFAPIDIDPNEYNTPENIYLYRINLSLIIGLIFAEPVLYNITDYGYHDFSDYDLIEKYASWAWCYGGVMSPGDNAMATVNSLESSGDPDWDAYNDYGYYGRNAYSDTEDGIATIMMAAIDFESPLWVPGLIGKEVLSENPEEVYVYDDDGIIRVAMVLLETGGTDEESEQLLAPNYVNTVEISEFNKNIRFKFSNCKPFPGMDAVADNNTKIFLINRAINDTYISDITIISKYIESPFLLSLDEIDRKLWVAEDIEGEVFFNIVVNGETALSEDIGSSDESITVADASLLPASGVIYIDGERISYDAIDAKTLTGAKRGDIPRSHLSGARVTGLNNMLYRKYLLGSLTAAIDDETATMTITEDGDFILPARMPYTDDETARERRGYIVIDEEIIDIGWGEYGEVITFTTALRGRRGTAAASHNVYALVYIYEYIDAGELIRKVDYRVDYSDQYKPEIILKKAGANEIDVNNSLRVYYVRVQWKS